MGHPASTGQLTDMTATKRAVIYARISETSEKIDKVGNQEAACRALASRCGYDIERVITDDGISALTDGKRPGYDALLDAIALHDFDVLLATEEARFARNMTEKTEITLSCAAVGITWHTVRDGETDPATDTGEFFATIRGAVDRFESRRKGARQKASNAARRAEGRPAPGRRLYGYEPDGITARPDEAATVQRIFTEVLDGATIYGIAHRLNADRIPFTTGNRNAARVLDKSATWRPGLVRQLVNNRRYCGDLGHAGEWTPSPLIEHIVSPDDAARARAILADDRRRITPGPSRRHLLSGIATCAHPDCLAKPAPATLKLNSGGVRHEPAYTCSASTAHSNMLASHVESIVKRELAYAIATGGDQLLKRAETSKGRSLADLIEQHRRTEIAAEAVTRDRADGLLTPDSARVRLIELRDERQRIEHELDATRAEDSAASVLLTLATDLMGNNLLGKNRHDVKAVMDAVLARFDALTLDRQRECVRTMLDIELLPFRDGTSRSGGGRRRSSTERVRVTHKLAGYLNPAERDAG